MLTPLQSRAEVRRIEWQGRNVCWRGFGAGRPLVLLHGGHGNWLHWVRNIEVLAARHRVWTADLPGFGDSDDLGLPPRAPERMQRLGEALIGTLDQLVGAGTPIDLAGFSFGGLAAAQLAARRGGVSRLALMGPGGHKGGYRRLVEFQDWRLPDPAARAAALRHNLEVFMLHDRAHADALAIAVHAQACEATRFRSKEVSLAGGLQAALDAATCPVLMMWGGEDVTCVAENVGPRLVAGHPERHWELVAGAGHWVQYEAAEVVNPRLVAWFGEGGDTRGAR